MDTQEKNEETQEVKRDPCLICGIRRRREDCLVCLPCSGKDGAVGQLKARVEAENQKAFLADELEKIVDPWDLTFVLVLEEGPKTIGKKQAELSEAIKLRKTRTAKLRSQAGKDVARKLATFGKGGDRAKYIAISSKRDFLIEACFEKLKQEDSVLGKAVKKVYGLGKSITAMREQLEDIKKKRAEHLKQVEESTDEGDEAPAAVA